MQGRSNPAVQWFMVDVCRKPTSRWNSFDGHFAADTGAHVEAADPLHQGQPYPIEEAGARVRAAREQENHAGPNLGGYLYPVCIVLRSRVFLWGTRVNFLSYSAQR